MDREAGQSESATARIATRLCREEAGQAITEYILLLSLVTAISVAVAQAILSILDQITMQFGGQLEQDLKSGRAPVNVFRN